MPFSTLKPTAIVALLVLSACTPLPTTRSQPSESPRPIPTLPFERLLQQRATPSQIQTNPTISAQPASKTARKSTSARLSTSEVAALLAEAEDKAISAANLTRSAQSQEDWNLVINQWKRAIALLKPISASGAQKARIQKDLADYQSRLASAQQQAKINPRQIIRGGSGSSQGGIPLIVAPASPSPTVSPTASPTASPTTSPTISPTPLPAQPPPPPQN